MYFVRYQQPYVRFVEPVMSEAQRVAFGLEISKRGKGHFQKEFRSRKIVRDVPPEVVKQQENFAKRSDGYKVLFGLLAGGFLVLACVLVPKVIPQCMGLCIIMGLFYWISFEWACFRHYLWLGRCLKAYKACAEYDDPDKKVIPVPPPAQPAKRSVKPGRNAHVLPEMWPKPVPINELPKKKIGVEECRNAPFTLAGEIGARAAPTPETKETPSPFRPFLPLVGFCAVCVVLMIIVATHDPNKTNQQTSTEITLAAQVSTHSDRVIASRVLAESIYPDLLNPASELSREVRKQIEKAKAAGNPIMEADDGPLRITKIAASQVNLHWLEAATPIPTDAVTQAVQSLEVRFSMRTLSPDGTQSVAYVGGRNRDGTAWSLSLAAAIDAISAGRRDLYVVRKGRPIHLTPMMGANGQWCLKSTEVGISADILSGLPDFPKQKQVTHKTP